MRCPLTRFLFARPDGPFGLRGILPKHIFSLQKGRSATPSYLNHLPVGQRHWLTLQICQVIQIHYVRLVYPHEHLAQRRHKRP